MSVSDETKQLYREWHPLTPGWHRLRVVGTRDTVAALIGCDGIEVTFDSAEPEHSGAEVIKTFWLSKKSIGRSKRTLKLLFGERDLDQIENLTDFSDIPLVWARLDHRDWEGDQVLDVVAIRLDRPEGVPDPSGQGD